MKISLIVATSLALAACGATPDATPGVVERDDVSEPALVGILGAGTCSTSDRAYHTAIEASYAQHGEDVTSAQELVDSGILDELPEHFDFVAATATTTATAIATQGGPCDYDYEAQLARQDAYAQTDEQIIMSGICAVGLITLDAAVRRIAIESDLAAPETVGDVVDAMPSLDQALIGVRLGPGPAAVPLALPCERRDLVVALAPEWSDISDDCLDDLLELSAISKVASVPLDDSPPNTRDLAELVRDGLTDDRPYLYSVAAGRIVDVLGTGCLVVEEPSDSPEVDAEPVQRSCDVDGKTLEIAIEAFFAVKGRPPQSIDELVDADMILRAPDGWALTIEAGKPLPSPTPTEAGPCAPTES